MVRRDDRLGQAVIGRRHHRMRRQRQHERSVIDIGGDESGRRASPSGGIGIAEQAGGPRIRRRRLLVRHRRHGRERHGRGRRPGSAARRPARARSSCAAAQGAEHAHRGGRDHRDRKPHGVAVGADHGAHHARPRPQARRRRRQSRNRGACRPAPSASPRRARPAPGMPRPRPPSAATAAPPSRAAAFPRHGSNQMVRTIGSIMAKGPARHCGSIAMNSAAAAAAQASAPPARTGHGAPASVAAASSEAERRDDRGRDGIDRNRVAGGAGPMGGTDAHGKGCRHAHRRAGAIERERAGAVAVGDEPQRHRRAGERDIGQSLEADRHGGAGEEAGRRRRPRHPVGPQSRSHEQDPTSAIWTL